jgi:pimeloyl-ACP methyl ester carboxylesterase
MRLVWALMIVTVAGCMPPSWGANALLHPYRRPLDSSGLPPHDDVVFTSDGLTLKGWLFRTTAPRRGLIVYLHGIGDNRRSGLGIFRRYGPSGWDVFTYDQRAHGESGGTVCTYGYREKQDLSRALDAVGAGRAVVFGSSLGGAVALQAAAEDQRIAAVIAQSAFSDLERIAHERAPWFASETNIVDALDLASAEGGFHVADVSPVRDAKRLTVPVLLVHGADDRETNVAHAEALDAALTAPHVLLIVAGAGHNDVLSSELAWSTITTFLAAVPPDAGEPPRP